MKYNEMKTSIKMRKKKLFINKIYFTILGILIFKLIACRNEKPQPVNMVTAPQLEYFSDRSRGDSIEKVRISIESFFVSNEVTNKQYREFTTWVKNNPEKILAITRERSVKIKDRKSGNLREYSYNIPDFAYMSVLLPMLIDSFALYKIDKNYRDYFTDIKYDDYPVVGVSRKAAEYFCVWKTDFETVTKNIRSAGKKVIVATGPESDFRLPNKIEWEFVANQPLTGPIINYHILHKADSGSQNKWGVSHLIDNVSEWIFTPDDKYAISRGGSWMTNPSISELKWMHPDSSNGFTGFRIVRTIIPAKISK